MPFSIFRVRTVAAANVVGFLLGAAIFANFFVLTLYVQQVLGWSPLRTGITFLATAGTTVLWAGLSQSLVTRIGVRPVLTAGLAIMGFALLWYTRIPVGGHYWPDLLPAYLVFALGMAFAFIPVSIAALAGVEPGQAGLASGLINTAQQVGGAIGVALATTIFVSATTGAHPRSRAEALSLVTTGYQHAFWAMAAIAFLGAAAAFVLLRGARVAVPEGEAARVPV
jgi:MFS family permease